MCTNKQDKDLRRKAMQSVKSTGSKIECALQKALWKKGYRYRKNYKKVFGKPDVVFMRHKIAVFVDSEFWHGFEWETRKHDFKSNQGFWWKKIERNIERDKLVTLTLRSEGWAVIRFWGSDITKNLDKCVDIVDNAIKERQKNLSVKMI